MILEDVVAEHLAELEGLFRRREPAVFSPRLTSVQLSRMDERIEAHRDALGIAGAHAVALAKDALLAEKDAAPAAAATAILAAGGPADLDALFAHFDAAEGPLRHGIRIALRHAPIARHADRLQRSAASNDAFLRAASADVLAFHRATPQPKLNDLIVHADPGVRRLAYDAIGRYGGPWSPDVLESSLDLDDPGLQRAALETSARLRTPRLVAICRQYGTRASRPVPAALAFLGVVEGPEAAKFLEPLLAHPELAPSAARALGALGLGASPPVLLVAMGRPVPAAAAAFARITGATGVAADPPEDDPDGDPPAFSAERAAAFWTESGRLFDAGRRYQLGIEGIDDRLPLAWRRDEQLRRIFTKGEGADVELERLQARVILGPRSSEVTP